MYLPSALVFTHPALPMRRARAVTTAAPRATGSPLVTAVPTPLSANGAGSPARIPDHQRRRRRPRSCASSRSVRMSSVGGVAGGSAS